MTATWRGMRWAVVLLAVIGLALLATSPMPAQQPKLRATLTGHTDRVPSLAFSPDGKALLSGSWDRTMKLWDVQSGQEKAILGGHREPVMSVAFSPDGSTVASASGLVIKLWNLGTGR